MTRTRAVLFDIDGTLLDSNDQQARAWLDALRGHGMHVPYEVVRSKIGMGDKLLEELVGVEPTSAEGRTILGQRSAILKGHYMSDLGPQPGGRALVDRVRSLGITCAAVASASSDEVDELLREATVLDLIDVKVSSDEADVIPLAIGRLGLAPAEVILVADTPHDIEAGARAGISVIALRCGGFNDEQLRGAVAVYDAPSDLVANLEASPLLATSTR